MISLTADGEAIALISLGLSIASILVRRAVIDQQKLKDLGKRTKELQKKAKEAQKAGDTDKALKINQEMMELLPEQMKMSFKPMLITMIPFLMIFAWLRSQYDNSGTVATLIGFELGWFWWYFAVSMASSIIINKLITLEDAPWSRKKQK